MRKLLWGVVLCGWLGSGCALFENRPGENEGSRPAENTCADPGRAPSPPVLRSLRETPTLPLASTTQVVMGYCPTTGAYIALGVDANHRAFTFYVGGGTSTRNVFTSQVHASGVPLVTYTRILTVKPRPSMTLTPPVLFDPCAQSLLQDVPGTANAKPSAPVAGGADAGTSGTGGTCAAPGTHCEIGDEPPKDPDNPNSWWNGRQRGAFQELAWGAAKALNTVSVRADQ
ncbi:hypothetical protein KRR26_08100 [Corallococcus sp. M34]|uniref:hypothetical protein n=1 Tax=Citreicoccus inhibens TaxID=2849499 RepID=UPI001C23563A|nr:hypothetical protein [Citreicoccus inhibens]MBU8895564.1 hypothetical protein [Citreicoccus inhibens]